MSSQNPILNLINRICTEKDRQVIASNKIYLEQEIISSCGKDLCWLCNDMISPFTYEIPSCSVGTGMGNELTISSKNNSCLYKNRDIAFQVLKQQFSTHPEIKVVSNEETKQPSSTKWKSPASTKRVNTNSYSWSSSKRVCKVNSIEEEDMEDDDDFNIHSQPNNSISSNESNSISSGFVTAKNQYIVDQQKKYGKSYNPSNDKNLSRGKSLGGKRRFSPPGKLQDEGMDSVCKSIFKGKSNETSSGGSGGSTSSNGTTGSTLEEMGISLEDLPEKLRSLEEKYIVNILNEIIYNGKQVTWDDIAGLAYAKKCIMEAIIWPMQRPDLFTGLRTVPRGLLLFGPPGTGKTLLGKAIANMCHCTFFSISASSLTSKWMGEGEKMVRALFGVAEFKAPSVIFIDEVDSLLSMRGENDMEGTRRIKTEFLVQLDGITASKENGNILVIGATNRPQDLDEAARRRFVKRLYIPLPDEETRFSLLQILLKKNENTIDEEGIHELVKRSDGYSCADIHNLCREAAMGPIRDISVNNNIVDMNPDHLRPIEMKDFDYAFRQVRASVGTDDLEGYAKWNDKYGSMGTST